MNHHKGFMTFKPSALLLFAMMFFCTHTFAQQKKPNVLVIFSDDHTEQAISAYGSKLMNTPNIDRIAKEGALLKNVFVTNSICAPSRAVLLTGKYSHINGLKDNGPNRYFDPEQQQLQKLLSTANYQTAWIGKWHLQTLPKGFDHWKILPDQGNYYHPHFIDTNNDTVMHRGYVTDLISDFALQWIGSRDEMKPFFLVVGEKATHRNWLPAIQDLEEFEQVEFPYPKSFNDDYAGRQAAANQDMSISKTMQLKYDLKVGVDERHHAIFGRMSEEERAAYKKHYDAITTQYEKIKDDSVALVRWKYQRYLKDYLATARSMDRNIGRILNYLDSAGLAENTLVIYTSDQGFYMGEHGWFDKRFMYEESLRTPFVVRYPGVISPGKKVNEMVMNLDIAPTILDFAGVSIPSDTQGESFSSLLKDGKFEGKWRESIYYHYYEYPEPHRVAPHFGIRTERYKLIRFYGPVDSWELYDLERDPEEMVNLYGRKGLDSLTGRLKSALLDLAIHYKDESALKILH